MQYNEFLNRKSQLQSMGGFEPLWIPEFLFDGKDRTLQAV